MMSPALTPDLSAGEPDLTEETQMPEMLPSGETTAWPLTPMEVTSLQALSWSMTIMASSRAMAKYWLVSLIEAKLTATTLPLASTSGPPELPGLIVAVCSITFSIEAQLVLPFAVALDTIPLVSVNWGSPSGNPAA